MGGIESCGYGQVNKVSKVGVKYCSFGVKFCSVDRNNRYWFVKIVVYSVCINFIGKLLEVRYG